MDITVFNTINYSTVQGKIIEGYWRNPAADREPVPDTVIDSSISLQSAKCCWLSDAAVEDTARRPKWKNVVFDIPPQYEQSARQTDR